MAMDNVTKQMVSGEKNAILDGFISASYIDNANAIINAVRHGMKDKPVEVQLQRLKNSDACVFGSNAGYKISDFAIAALHLLGISEYTGSDELIVALIDSNLGIS